MVWGNGPFECRLYNDTSIFNTRLAEALENVERFVAERGYSKSRASTPNKEPIKKREMNNRFWARQEIFNERLKQFNVFCKPFEKWFTATLIGVFAALNVVHLMMSTSNPLFVI